MEATLAASSAMLMFLADSACLAANSSSDGPLPDWRWVDAALDEPAPSLVLLGSANVDSKAASIGSGAAAGANATAADCGAPLAAAAPGVAMVAR